MKVPAIARHFRMLQIAGGRSQGTVSSARSLWQVPGKGSGVRIGAIWGSFIVRSKLLIP